MWNYAKLNLEIAKVSLLYARCRLQANHLEIILIVFLNYREFRQLCDAKGPVSSSSFK